jgi:uncharacterized lipoprotein
MSRIQALVLGLVALAGCSGRGELSCEDSSRYVASASIPPLRIPDDLSVPDESQALRIPEGAAADVASREPGRCLETPPDFLSGVAPAQPAQPAQ